MNCLSVFDHFMGLALKGLIIITVITEIILKLMVMLMKKDINK